MKVIRKWLLNIRKVDFRTRNLIFHRDMFNNNKRVSSLRRITTQKGIHLTEKVHNFKANTEQVTGKINKCTITVGTLTLLSVKQVSCVSARTQAMWTALPTNYPLLVVRTHHPASRTHVFFKCTQNSSKRH